jgi:hypothetical protein
VKRLSWKRENPGRPALCSLGFRGGLRGHTQLIEQKSGYVRLLGNSLAERCSDPMARGAGRPQEHGSRFEQFSNDMTAIVIAYTKVGLIVAADGRARLEGDSTIGTDHQQKIFHATIGKADIAWTLAGNVFVGTFSLVDAVKKSMDAANSSNPLGCSPWLDVFAAHLRNSVSEARNSKLIPPFMENSSHPNPAERSVFATVFMAGYFCNGKPSSAQISLAHEKGELLDPLPSKLVAASFSENHHNVYYGSQEIILRYHNLHQDKRFLKYFRASGRTLEEGLAHAKGCIEACCDPLAREIDPIICNKIGGHIHAAAVTSSGFKWLIPPKESESI